MYTYEEVMEYIEQEDVKFIRLAFCDLYGRQKNIAIMPHELKRAFETGISFDASAVPGFGSAVRSDLLLFPDPSTLAVLPWRPASGRVVRMFCDIRHPDGQAFAQDTRRILRQTAAKAAACGVHFRFGAEMEFYLFELDEKGHPTREPFDRAGYMDIAPEDKGENVRREICLYLEEMGILPESSHHEEGPGQNEIDFRYSDVLTAADQAVTFKSVVSTVSMQNGLAADFSPKPLPGESGSGMHINMSLDCGDGKEHTEAFLAGVLEHIREMTVFLNPTESSYRRLGEKKAPRYITWSPENRSQLIRIPAAFGEYRRIELRSPDPMANPYLAYALLMEAGLDGLRRGLQPPATTNHNLFVAGREITSALETLPGSLSEAQACAEGSSWLPTVLAREVIDGYCRPEER